MFYTANTALDTLPLSLYYELLFIAYFHKYVGIATYSLALSLGHLYNNFGTCDIANDMYVLVKICYELVVHSCSFIIKL